MRAGGVVSSILALLLWATGIEAYFGIDYDAKASYMNYESGGNSLYVFALNAVANGDIYFHMSGPVTHSWLGMGIGSEMANSFMIIAYPSANGLNTTISTRIATGHNEPTYTPDFEIIGVYNDTYAPNANTVTDDGTGTIIAHAMCRNCSRWATGFLDTQSKAQPFLFAFGPEKQFRSDSPQASIPRHALHGRYTIDMTQATNYTGWYGRVPAPNVPQFSFPPDGTAFASFGTSPVIEVKTMSNPMPTVHAVLMCVAFVLIFPAGAVVMQFLKRALWHAAIQVVGFVAVFAGFGIAVHFAGQYNKVSSTYVETTSTRKILISSQSKDFNSAHQIIGLIILAGLLMQLGLGLVHHTMYVRSNSPTPFGRVHSFLGPFIMVLGLINAGVGFDFAGKSYLLIQSSALS